jgi:hypothetical protein
MEGKWVISCAVNSFWMAKLILLNTTSGDLEDTTLLCMTLKRNLFLNTTSNMGFLKEIYFVKFRTNLT